jgi:hypothetical protein
MKVLSSSVPETTGPDVERKPRAVGQQQSTTRTESDMKPMCPHCGSLMSFSGIKSRSGTPSDLRTFCCEPCRCVFSDALTPTGTAARAMLLDLQANVQLGAMH